MHLKTILNRVYHHTGFVYTKFKLSEAGATPTLHVTVEPRIGSRPTCSKCNEKGPGYDTLEPRKFEFIPLWGITIFFLYAMRRVECARCGVTVEVVPWATGKSSLTKAYAHFLASWAKRLSWTDVAKSFHTSWEKVFHSVQLAVEWGLEHRSLDGVTAIGIDEVAWLKGKFLTVVYQIDAGMVRLLWVGEDRKAQTLLKFFFSFGPKFSKGLRFVCTDMWQPYLAVIALMAGHAIHILDRFHIMANMNKEIDEVRRQEVKDLKAKGQGEVLKGARWTLLKRPENRTNAQDTKLAELVKYNLRSVRAHLQREEFQHFWTYTSTTSAAGFLDRWCTRVMRSRLEPMKKIARSLRTHKPLILNWFRARAALVSFGATEGMNNKLKVITRRSYGFRVYKVMEIALYHALGNLPDPADEIAHRFY